MGLYSCDYRSGKVEVLGMLGTMPTITSFVVTPFVGVIADGLMRFIDEPR